MTAPFYANGEVLFNLGEVTSPDDWNNVQRFERAAIWDMIVGGRIRSNTTLGPDENGDGPEHTRLFAQGAAPVIGGANQIYTRDGTILHYPNVLAFDGSDAFTHAARIHNNPLASTFAVGDATNPRIDLLVVKVDLISNDATDDELRAYQSAVGVAPIVQTFVKRRKPVPTPLVVAGTPAANPSEPAVPSGYLKIASVWIPATTNAVYDVQNIRDWRYPAGFDRHTTWCIGPSGGSPQGDVLAVPSTTSWAYNANGVLATGTPGAAVYVVPRLRAKADARLIRLTLAGLLNHTTVTLVRLNFESTFSGIHETLITDLSSNFNTSANTPLIANCESLGTQNGSNDRAPVWGNGEAAGVACYTNPKANPNDARLSTVALKLVAGASAADYIKLVQWDFAAF